jgi:hypothetical protein
LISSYAALQLITNPPQLSSIPTAGASGFSASFITGVRFFKHAQEIIQDGYNKVSLVFTEGDIAAEQV